VARILFLAVGLACVALAGVGLFVPLLPTTPFLLLAAACFARSSRRLHGWLLAHRVFGSILADWEAHGAIRLRVKVAATVLSGGMVSYPILFEDFPLPLKAVAGASVLAVLVFVWTRPLPPGPTPGA
jgi:uncharacterized membrane protein YbaN (DUF454 family)